MSESKLKVGDKVKIDTGIIVGTGVIKKIVPGGENIGFPWKDDTPHYVFEDEETGYDIIVKRKYIKKEG